MILRDSSGKNRSRKSRMPELYDRPAPLLISLALAVISLLTTLPARVFSRCPAALHFDREHTDYNKFRASPALDRSLDRDRANAWINLLNSFRHFNEQSNFHN